MAMRSVLVLLVLLVQCVRMRWISVPLILVEASEDAEYVLCYYPKLLGIFLNL